MDFTRITLSAVTADRLRTAKGLEDYSANSQACVVLAAWEGLSDSARNRWIDRVMRTHPLRKTRRTK
jgi:hypothetical protein